MGYWEGRTVLVTGGGGFIGSHVVELLAECGVPRHRLIVPRSSEYDLRRLADCERAVRGCDVVFHLAAVTGGIAFSRSAPAAQYYDSTLMDLHMIEAARGAGVDKFVAIGNLFAYSASTQLPLREAGLFEGLPAEAHRGVGCLKRNLAVLADINHRQYGFPMVVVYAANAYGPGDSLNLDRGHVIPSTILKCLSGDRLTVWGDGSATRDFLYVRDVARGLILAAERLEPPGYVNLGSGEEVSIRQLVTLITECVGFQGEVHYDLSKAGGESRRSVDVTQAAAHLGFAPTYDLRRGIETTVGWYRRALALPA